MFVVIWALCCLVGAVVATRYDRVLAGMMIMATPTLVGVVAKPTFAACCVALMLPLGGGLAYEGWLSGDRVVGVMAALGILANCLFTGRGIRSAGSPLLPLWLIAIWAVVISGLAVYPMPALAGAFTLFQLCVWGLAIWNALAYEGNFIWPLRCYAGSLLALCVQVFLSGSLERLARAGERVTVDIFTEVNPADFAAHLGAGTVLCIYLALRDRSKWLKIVWTAGVFILPAMMIQTASRGPLLALAVAVVASLLSFPTIARSRAMLIGIPLMAMLVLGGGYWSLRSGLLGKRIEERLVSEHSRERALGYRVHLVANGIAFTLTHPLGAGWANYTLVGMQEHNVHTEIIYIGTVLGVPGMALYVWFFWRLFRAHRKTRSPPERWYARTIMIFLAIAGCAHVIFAQKTFWFSALASAAIAYRMRQEEHAEAHIRGTWLPGAAPGRFLSTEQAYAR